MKEQKSTNAILYTIILSQFILPFMISGIGITLPIMGKEMNASGVALGLVEIVFLGASCALVLPFGRIADMTNKEAIYKTGLITTFITSLLLGFTNSIQLFIAIRLLQGITCSLIVATNMAILTDIIPRNQLGKVFGLSIGVVYAGLSMGPFIAGVITEQLGWRWIYYITSTAVLITYIVSVRLLKGKWKKLDVPFDWIGSLLVIIILTLWITGSSFLDKGLIGIVLILAGLALIPFFVIIEKRVQTPLLELTLFRSNTVFTGALAVQLLLYSGAFGVIFLFSLYLQTIRQYTPQEAGLVLMISPILIAIMTPMFGRLADKLDSHYLSGTGAFSIFLGTAIATQISKDSSMTLIYTVLVFHGFGFAMFSSPNMKIIMTSIDKTRSSIASALAAEMRNLGMIISMLIVTLFLSSIMGNAQISIDTADRFLSVIHYSMITLSFAGAITVVLSVLSGKKTIKSA